MIEPHNSPSSRILIVDGSPRTGGNSHLVLQRIALGAQRAGVETEIVHLRDHEFSPCIGCELCRTSGICTRFDDGMTPLYEKIMSSRGLVLSSPVHNYNMTAWMKAFIDRLYCFYEFEEPRPGPWSSLLANQGRAALVTCTAEQNDINDIGFTLEGMRRPIEALGYHVLAELPVLGVFEKGAVRDKHEALELAEAHGAALAQTIERAV